MITWRVSTLSTLCLFDLESEGTENRGEREREAEKKIACATVQSP